MLFNERSGSNCSKDGTELVFRIRDLLEHRSIIILNLVKDLLVSIFSFLFFGVFSSYFALLPLFFSMLV